MGLPGVRDEGKGARLRRLARAGSGSGSAVALGGGGGGRGVRERRFRKQDLGRRRRGRVVGGGAPVADGGELRRSGGHRGGRGRWAVGE